MLFFIDRKKEQERQAKVLMYRETKIVSIQHTKSNDRIWANILIYIYPYKIYPYL